MQHEGFLKPQRRLTCLTALFTALLTVAATAGAQSGRKPPPKRTDSPPLIVTGESSQPAEQPAPEKRAKALTQIFVVRSQGDYAMPGYYIDAVAQSCSDELRSGASASVTMGKEMNRKEASDHAKKSTDTYVLWLSLEYDRFASQQTNSYQDGIYIDYTLFAPSTGKPKTSGRVYPGDRRNRVGVGGVGIPLPVPKSGAGTDYLLRESGREIAKRVISSLDLVRPGQ